MKILLKASFVFFVIFFFIIFLISCSKNYDPSKVGAVVSGKVINSNDEPIGGATIYVDDVAKGESASDGTFIITGVNTGVHTFKAKVGSSSGSTQVIVKTLLDEIADVSIKVEQSSASTTGKVVGRVLDANTGEGINNVTVTLEEMNLTTLTVSGSKVSSDSTIQTYYGNNPSGDGYFVISNVDTGTFRLTFSKQGYQDSSAQVTVSSSQSEVKVDDVYLSYDLNSAGVIAGKVTDASGNPVANASVTLDTGQTTTTNSNGDYKLENLPERIYDPVNGENGYSLTVTSGTETQTASKISVYSGKTTIVDITMGVALTPPNLVVPEDGAWVSMEQPIFNWTGVGGADYYKVLVYEDSNTSGAIEEGTDKLVWMYETSNATTTSVTYNTDANGLSLTNETQYIWTVRAASFSSVSDLATPHTFTKKP